MDRKPPAMVLGAGANGLGVARSLARARVPVWLLETDACCPERHTRAARFLPVRALHGETLVEELVRLGTGPFRNLRPVLFLTREESVRTVSCHRGRLLDLYRFSLPAAETVDALTHKRGFQRVAERLGSPVPPLVHVHAPADLAALETLHYPAVVKPGERHAEYGRHFRKAYRVESAAEAMDLVRRILAVMQDVVVQEWIEGPDDGIHFCLQYRRRDGTVAASFSGRKIRSWPPQVGGTASCVAAPDVHRELSCMTDRFFGGADVVGMVGMEYKRDARSGMFRMVEPTIGRTDYQEEVATLNGVNMPYAAWCSESGALLPAPVPTRRPVVWRVRSEDARSAAAQGQQPGQGRPRGARVADALFRWNDPLPFLAQGLRRVRRALRARLSGVTPASPMAGGES